VKVKLNNLGLSVLLFGLSLFLADTLAADAEEQSDAAQDSTVKTTGPAAPGERTFDPPHDDHAHSTPEHPTHASGASASGGTSLASAASDPTAILTMFQNFFWTTGTSDDNNVANTYLLQPVLPLSNRNVFRPALPVVNTSGKTGFGDLFLLDLQFFPLKSGTFGIGIAGSVPIGADEFSTDKWQAGPAAVYINKTNEWGIWGVLAYNQWSFAGKDSAQSVNLFTGQPVLVVHENWGYWGWTDQTITYDWKNNLSSVPLGFRFGNVTKLFGNRPVKMELGFYYTLNNKGRDNTFGVKFQFSPIFPELLKH
jgi:hypothetical protein